MLRKIFLILSAILIVVSAVTFFFFLDAELARRFLGAAMVSIALSIISFIIWETEGVHQGP